MYYETPQFIREETKLMGVLTFTQLWILVGFGGILAILFFVLNFTLWLILALILGPLALLLAFGQMNGQPFYKILPSALRHFWLPKYYFWQKENISNEPAPLPPKASTSTLPKPTKTLDQKTLDQLSHFLDQ